MKVVWQYIYAQQFRNNCYSQLSLVIACFGCPLWVWLEGQGYLSQQIYVPDIWNSCSNPVWKHCALYSGAVISYLIVFTILQCILWGFATATSTQGFLSSLNVAMIQLHCLALLWASQRRATSPVGSLVCWTEENLWTGKPENKKCHCQPWKNCMPPPDLNPQPFLGLESD